MWCHTAPRKKGKHLKLPKCNSIGHFRPFRQMPFNFPFALSEMAIFFLYITWLHVIFLIQN
jgi:hypothetical protein